MDWGVGSHRGIFPEEYNAWAQLTPTTPRRPLPTKPIILSFGDVCGRIKTRAEIPTPRFAWTTKKTHCTRMYWIGMRPPHRGPASTAETIRSERRGWVRGPDRLADRRGSR